MEYDIRQEILNQIAEKIREGYTSGRVDNKESNNYWEIKINTWKEGEY